MEFAKQRQVINEIAKEIEPVNPIKVEQNKPKKEKCTGKQIHLINKLLMEDIQDAYANMNENQKLDIQFNPLWNNELLLTVSYDVTALTIYPSCTKSIATSLIDTIKNSKKYKLVIKN